MADSKLRDDRAFELYKDFVAYERSKNVPGGVGIDLNKALKMAGLSYSLVDIFEARRGKNDTDEKDAIRVGTDPVKGLTHATEEQGSFYINKAKRWVTETKAPFSDAKGVASFAIAEFLANQDGLTLYER